MKKPKAKSTFIIKRRGALYIAKRNTIADDEQELISIYYQGKAMGLDVVADRITAKNEHIAAMKFRLLHEAHDLMLVACLFNIVLLFLGHDILINIFVGLASVMGYGYSIFSLYKSQSPMLQELIIQNNTIAQN